MAKDEFTYDDLSNTIKNIASEINAYYLDFNNKIKILESCKDLIILKKNDNFDDYKFYTGLISNSYFYYKNSSEIRVKKLSKDLKAHCKTIKIQHMVSSDIYFNTDIIKQILDAYKETIKEQESYDSNNRNRLFWIKDNNFDRFEEWPKILLYLLNYHKLVIEMLLECLKVELKFLKAQKTSYVSLINKKFKLDSYHEYSKENIMKIHDINNSVNTSLLSSNKKKSFEDLQLKFTKLKDLNTSLQENVENFKTSLSEKQENVENLKTSLSEKQENVENLETSLSEKQENVENLETSLSEKQENVENLETSLSEKEANIENLETSLSEKEANIEKLREELETLKTIIISKDKEIETLKTTITSKDKEIERLKTTITTKNIVN